MLRSPIVATALLAAALAVLYAWRLGDVPVYLSPDEAIIAVDAHALASTGADVRGERFPLYFRIQMPGEERWGWFTPAIFYLMAAVLKLLPMGERVVRLPSVLVGVVDVVLLFLVARKLFARAAYAWIAAAVLALSPAHFMLSRYALDYIYPLPFLLAWLLCLLTFLDRRDARWLFAATVCLGLGFYSYIASVLLMTLYLAITAAVLLAIRETPRAYAIAAAGFTLPLVPFALWVLRHPTVFSDTAARYALYDTKHLNALQGLREFLGYPNLDRLSALYWSYFSPSFLFFSGDRQMPFSTRSAGAVPMALALLLPLGVYQVIVRRPTIPALLAVVGFVTAPMAAVLVPEPAAIIRAVPLLPFAALLAAFGVECLWSGPAATLHARPVAMAGASAAALGVAYAVWMVATKGRLGGATLLLVGAGGVAVAASRLPAIDWRRLAACALVAWLPLQFARFASDYFGDYRIRSSPWLGGNLRGALEQMIARVDGSPDTRVYFATLQSTAGEMDTRNRWMDAYWRFYLGKHRREDLLARTGHFDAADPASLPPRSVVLANIGDPRVDAMRARGSLRTIAVVPELDGEPFFVVLERP